MSVSVLVVVATRDRDKILAAVMYATNAFKRGWVDDVDLIFFGPSEGVLAGDVELLSKVVDMAGEVGLKVAACKAIADEGGFTLRLAEKGVEVFYVGEYVSRRIREGYRVMVW